MNERPVVFRQEPFREHNVLKLGSKGGVMRYIWMFLIMMLMVALLAACQAANPPAEIPEEATVGTEAPGFTPADNAPQTLAPTFPEEDTDMTPVTPPNETAEKLVNLVKQHLAKKLGFAVDQIVLSEIKPVIWRDAGLGCPKPGVDYIQIETPGYNILLEAGGKSYRYHTDETKRFVQCNK
jgi:hypothetical protein